MSIPRFFMEGELPEGDIVTLPFSDKELHHLAVRRIREGEHIAAVAAGGKCWEVEIETIDEFEATGRCIQEMPLEKLPDLTLVQGISKGDRMGQTIRQTTELGIGRIIPFLSARTVVRLAVDERGRKGSRWRRIALSAAKQSGRNILPIVEGCTVTTKYGPVKTDYILFIAAGAFHVAKVTDLIPELQGRFPVRVNLKPLTREDFKAILSQTDNALTRQYEALLAVDHVHLHFEESALDALAQAAQQENETREDIGARRLHTLFEKMLEDISFNAGGDMPDVDVTINGDYVAEHLGGDGKKLDMRQYIL